MKLIISYLIFVSSEKIQKTSFLHHDKSLFTKNSDYQHKMDVLHQKEKLQKEKLQKEKLQKEKLHQKEKFFSGERFIVAHFDDRIYDQKKTKLCWAYTGCSILTSVYMHQIGSEQNNTILEECVNEWINDPSINKEITGYPKTILEKYVITETKIVDSWEKKDNIDVTNKIESSLNKNRVLFFGLYASEEVWKVVEDDDYFNGILKAADIRGLELKAAENRSKNVSDDDDGISDDGISAHTLIIVGYNKDYFYIKNSYGKQNGLDGYFLLEKKAFNELVAYEVWDYEKDAKYVQDVEFDFGYRSNEAYYKAKNQYNIDKLEAQMEREYSNIEKMEKEKNLLKHNNNLNEQNRKEIHDTVRENTGNIYKQRKNVEYHTNFIKKYKNVTEEHSINMTSSTLAKKHYIKKLVNEEDFKTLYPNSNDPISMESLENYFHDNSYMCSMSKLSVEKHIKNNKPFLLEFSLTYSQLDTFKTYFREQNDRLAEISFKRQVQENFRLNKKRNREISMDKELASYEANSLIESDFPNYDEVDSRYAGQHMFIIKRQTKDGYYEIVPWWIEEGSSTNFKNNPETESLASSVSDYKDTLTSLKYEAKNTIDKYEGFFINERVFKKIQSQQFLEYGNCNISQ